MTMNPRYSSMKTPMTIVLLALCALLFSCASKTEKTVKPNAKTENTDQRARELQDEISIGREMAAKLFGTFGALNSEVQKLEYLNLIIQTLAEKAGRPEIVYRVGILDSDEINAFAAPGGYILVTKGLLNNIQNEHELAGVLAHEMGHINHRHLFKEVAPKREISTGESLSRFLSRGGANMTFALGQAVSKGMKMLTDEGLKPELEFEADQSGVEYSWATGYDPRYFRNFMSRLAQNQKSKSKTLLKTHPTFESRIKQLDVQLVNVGLESPAPNLVNPIMLKRFAVISTENK